jgi:hypothetical protein
VARTATVEDQVLDETIDPTDEDEDQDEETPSEPIIRKYVVIRKTTTEERFRVEAQSSADAEGMIYALQPDEETVLKSRVLVFRRKV